MGTKKNFNLKIKLKNDQSSSAIKRLKNDSHKKNTDYSSGGGGIGGNQNDSGSISKTRYTTNMTALNANIMRSSTKEEILNNSNLSGGTVTNPYQSNQKVAEHYSAIETSNIVDEKMSSDMSFTLNFNEIIGSIDEKQEILKMKTEL